MLFPSKHNAVLFRQIAYLLVLGIAVLLYRVL